MKGLYSVCAVAGLAMASAMAEPVDGFFWPSAWWAVHYPFAASGHYWADGVVPSDGGVAYYLGREAINLQFTQAVTLRGIDLGNVQLTKGKPSICGSGLTLTGDAFISGNATEADIATLDDVVHGTGGNTFSKRGLGSLSVQGSGGFAGFATIAAVGGSLSSSGSGALFAADNPSFAVRGGMFRWAPSLADGASGSASLGATTYGPGSGGLVWSKGSGAAATLTLASLTSEGNGSTLLVANAGGPSALGESEKLLVSAAPSLVNGLLDPGIVVQDTAVESWPLSFTTYDAEKGVVPVSASSRVPLADAAATHVAVVTADTTLAESKRVAALSVENASRLVLAADTTLSVGDDDAGHPAGVIFNMQNRTTPDDASFFEGAGTLDFGNAPGLLWVGSPTLSGWGYNRQLMVRTRITGANGVTFASRPRGNTPTSAGIFTIQNGGFGAWQGPTRISGAILWVQEASALPAGDVYVLDGSGCGGQFRIGAGGWTLPQNFFLAGRGPIADGNSLVFLQDGTTAFGGNVTLLGDAVFASANTGKSIMTFNKGVQGPGSLLLENGGTLNFMAASSFRDLVTRGGATVNVHANGTLGTGRLWFRTGSNNLVFNRPAASLVLDNPVRVESGASLGAKLDNARVAFAKDVTFSGVTLGNFSTLSVGGVMDVGHLKAVGARDTKIGNYGQDQITGAAPGGELRVGRAADDALGLPMSDGAGTLAFTKKGSGTLALAPAARTYTGATTVNEGVVKLTVDPRETPSLLYWMDASRPGDFEKDEAGVIAKWNSRGGSANVSFSVLDGTPTWGTAEPVNGHAVVTTKKNGDVADRLRANVALEQRTVFIVYRLNQIVKFAGIFGGRDFYDDYGVRTDGSATDGWWDANSSHYCYNTTGWIRHDGGKNGAVDQGVPHILTLVHDRDNWDPNISWGKKTYGCTFKADLGYYLSAQRNFDGDYCEILAFDRVLTESEMRVVENYLSEKWLNRTIWSDLAVPAHLPSATALTVAAGATLDLNGNSLTVASLAGNGTVTNSSATAATLTVTDGGSFGGRVGGPVTVAAGGSFAAGSDLLGPPTDHLAYWCDAGRRETILQDDSGAVTSWVSRAASSASALHNVGTLHSGGSASVKSKPNYSADGLGGRPCIDFTTSGTRHRALWADVNSPVRTVFLVVAANGVQTGNCAGIWGVGCLEAGFRFSNKSLTLESGGGFVRPTDPQDWVHMDGVSYGNDAIALGDKVTRVISARLEAAHHRGTSFRDALGLDAENPTRCTVLGSYVGNPAFVGRVGEVIAYDRELSDDEMRRVEAYLMRKWKTLEWTEGHAPASYGETGLADGALSLLPGAALDVSGGATFGTLGGGGSVTGDISVRNGFDVTVKPDGTTDTLVVDGAVALGPDAVLNVINPGNLQNGVFATFLSATSITGTFAGSNLEKPNGWSVSKTSAKLYRSAGTVLVFR